VNVTALILRFALALWVGGTLVVVLAAPVVFGRIASRDAAGSVFGEILRRFEAVKQALSLLLVVNVFVGLEKQTTPGKAEIAAIVCIFLAVATNVYLSMVLRPRMNYFRMKVASFDAAAPDDPFRQRFDQLHRRSIRILTLGALAAALALILTP
jgi:uncharacterized membrane protein